jgi:stearoyl-CoA 9-desaturase NADPH oxidoreductase
VVEQGAAPRVSKVRRRALKAAKSLTTPLLPDDYIELMNPMWTTRELRGLIEDVRPETEDASTIVIRPSSKWLGHWPGQYLRIGVEINGRRHWRAYSLTSDPDHPDGLISITIKHVPEGKLSPYFTRQAEIGSMVYLGGVEGEFRIPYPRPEQLLFISAGSGVTPIWSMVRNLAKDDALRDARHIHCCRDADDFIFGETLRKLRDEKRGYELEERHSKSDDRLTPEELDDMVPDWRDRETFLSGPPEMLEAMKDRWEAEGDLDRLHLERFQPVIGGDSAKDAGEGGTVRFRVTEVEGESDGKTPILECGENAGAKLPFGCRMGICHTCVGKLAEGKVRDLRTGEVHGDEGQMIRTCVNAPEGHVEIEL